MRARDLRFIALPILILGLALSLGYVVPTLAGNVGTARVEFVDDVGNPVSGGTLTLTAIAPAGYEFHHWEDADGNTIGTDPTLELTMDGDKHVKAVFAKLDTTPPDAPVVSSFTHPDESKWYSSSDPAFTWTAPSDPSGIAGYSYALDQSSGTTPAEVVDSTGNTASYSDVADGTWYFHVRAQDGAGNWGAASHYQVNIDTMPPVINTCVSDKTVEAGVGCQAAIPDLTADVTVNDNCDDSLTVTQDPVAGAMRGLGAHTVTLTVTDDAGNHDSCEATVTVVDNIAPLITCPGDATVSTDAGVCYATGVGLGTPTVDDNCPGVGTPTNDASTQFPKGNTTVTWTVQDAAGNEAICTQTVTVEDNEDPTIVCPADVNVACPQEVVLGQATAADNCDSDVDMANDAPDTFPYGVTTVTWTATDDAGNRATCTQQVTVKDTEAPKAKCKGITVSLDSNGQASISASDVDGGSSDNCAIKSRSINKGIFTCADKGANTVTLTVEDAAGNSDSCTATVTVVDNTPPSIACPADVTVNADENCQATDVDLGTPVVSDNCDPNPAVSSDAPASFLLGTTAVTWMATDDDGNRSTCTQKVMVIDNTPPTITSCSSDKVLCANAEGRAPIPDLTEEVVASDNCDTDPEVMQSPAAGTIVEVGIHTVTLTVTDDASNSSICQATVIVNPKPTAAFTSNSPVCFPAAVEFTDATSGGTPPYTYEWSFGDGLGTSTEANPSYTYDAIGTYTVILRVTDANGCWDITSRSVTVRDCTSPSLSVLTGSAIACACEDALVEATVSDTGGSGLASVTIYLDGEAHAMTPAGDDRYTYTIPGEGKKAGSSITYYLEATDGAGNTTTSDAYTVTWVECCDHIEIAPSWATIGVGESITYTAEAFDTCGDSMGDVTDETTFSISPRAGGAWEGNVYTAQTAGYWVVRGWHRDCGYDSAWLRVTPVGFPAVECPVCPALVVFHSNRDGNWELYRTGPFEGEEDVRLTEDPADDIAPARSPDGQWIVFQSDRNDNWDLYLMGINGGSERRLTYSPADDVDPAWSPSCEEYKIAFQTNRHGHWDIYTMDLETGEEKRLTHNWYDDTDPFWSPDAGRIAFQSNRDGDWEIYVIDVETRIETKLTDNAADDVDPVWSPDGRWILFRTNRHGNWELYLVDVGTGEELRLTDNAGEDRNAVWSPDSQRIAFQSDRDGNWEVYVIGVDGTGERNLTDNPAADEAPTWSCEGEDIVFHTDRDGNLELYAMSSSDGSGLRRLTEEPSKDVFPMWMPPEEDGSLALP